MKTPAQTAPASNGTTSTQGTSVSGGSGAGVYTSTKVELVASTDYDWAGVWVYMTEGTTIGSLFKLYTGGSGSETEFVELVGSRAGTAPMNIFVPCEVPAGSRVSAAKADADGFGAAARIHIAPVRGRSTDPLSCRGTLIGVSSGSLTNVDAGGTANTKGSWVELAASTSRDANGFTLVGYGDASCDTNVRYFIDVGIGAASSEQVIFADAAAATEGFRSDLNGLPLGPIWTPIPAGSRVAVRCQCSSNSANSRIPRLAMILWE